MRVGRFNHMQLKVLLFTERLLGQNTVKKDYQIDGAIEFGDNGIGLW
jgi:hypothetical protein